MFADLELLHLLPVSVASRTVGKKTDIVKSLSVILSGHSVGGVGINLCNIASVFLHAPLILWEPSRIHHVHRAWCKGKISKTYKLISYDIKCVPVYLSQMPLSTRRVSYRPVRWIYQVLCVKVTVMYSWQCVRGYWVLLHLSYCVRCLEHVFYTCFRQGTVRKCVVKLVWYWMPSQ